MDGVCGIGIEFCKKFRSGQEDIYKKSNGYNGANTVDDLFIEINNINGF